MLHPLRVHGVVLSAHPVWIVSWGQEDAGWSEDILLREQQCGHQPPWDFTGVFLFMAVLLAGCGAPLQFAGPILLALFPLLIFASSIWVGCSQGQRLLCHLCTASYSKTPQIFLQVLLVNKVKLKNHGSTGVPPEMCSHTTYLPIAVETQKQKWNLNKTSVKNCISLTLFPLLCFLLLCFLYYSLWGFISFTVGQILSTPNRLIDLTLLALFPYLFHLKCMEWGILQGIQQLSSAFLAQQTDTWARDS